MRDTIPFEHKHDSEAVHKEDKLMLSLAVTCLVLKGTHQTEIRQLKKYHSK